LNQTASLSAPAKVNLFLRVLHRRSDGFHELETLFQAIDYCDDILVELNDLGQISLEVTGLEVGPVKHNLAYRAASAYREAAGLQEGIHVRLTKHIPAGAGLGGGSSDAAAVLRGLDYLTEGLLDTEALRKIASNIGSDVSFFLCHSTTALAHGRGEILEPIKPLPQEALLLILPPVHVSTRNAYEMLGRSSDDNGHHTGLSLIRARRDWDTIISSAHNDFEVTTADLHPEVRCSLGALRQKGYPLVLLSGSGAACFAIARNGGDVQSDARDLTEELGWPCLVTRTLESYPPVTPMFAKP
jgi:4-diphosphocytidyl-2-C-methyl-D-erythritol kinase